MKSVWIGWPGIFVEDRAKQEKIERILADFNCVPVWHEQATVMKYL